MEEKLQELKKWCSDFIKTQNYKDPDSLTDENSRFYRKYVEVLNNRTHFISSENEKFSVRFDETGIEPGVIFEKIRGTKVISKYYLKSDQFGFSRPDGDMKYPYEIYLQKISEEGSEKKIEEAKQAVINWINETRIVGGSFFWPMNCKKDGKINKNPYYNLSRGISSYIQDRVDLTLFEIYEYYESKNEDIDTKGNLLISNTNSNPTMKSWLDEFKSFKEYVKFFGLNPFVDKKTGRPFNLLSEEEDKVFDEKIDRVPKLDSNITSDEYKRLFNRIVKKIKERRELLGIKEDENK